MIFKHFTLRIIWIVILIAVTGLGVVWSFITENLVMTRITFSTLWIFMTGYLIYYVNKTNRTLAAFLESLRYLDSVQTQTGRGRSFEELDRLYNEIVGIIRRVEIERETDRHYLKRTVDHIGVGILSFNEKGEVELLNDYTRRLFHKQKLENISSLSDISPELPDLLASIQSGQHKLFKVPIDNEMTGLSLKAVEFRLLDRKVKLVSIQNIKNELEEEEQDAWQKLIRVLTHEIMNSVTPVNSLTSTVIRMFEREGKPLKPAELDAEAIQNALEGLHSIEKRNKGLVAFVKSYKTLTRIPRPNKTEFPVSVFLRSLHALVKNDLNGRQIKLSINQSPGSLMLYADEKLLEQVLLNLINNAVHALDRTKDPGIVISAYTYKDHVIISVADNGHGIAEEVIGNIFIPFFTTRKEGSGIGLSLSRQIMRLHNGSITVRSRPGDTVFTLKFPSRSL